MYGVICLYMRCDRSYIHDFTHDVLLNNGDFVSSQSLGGDHKRALQLHSQLRPNLQKQPQKQHHLPDPSSLSSPASQDQPHALETIWNQIKKHLPEHLEPAMINHYIHSLEVSYTSDTVILEVPNVNYYQGLVDHVLPILHNIRSQQKALIHFSIQIRPRTPQLQTHTHNSLISKKTTAVAKKISAESGINRQYTFDTYIKGSSNQFTYAICQNIIKQPGMTYNPLFIYGHSGIGKTHLLHAVGHALSQPDAEHPVILTTTDNFMSELIHCIRHKKQHKFKEKYRHCSALLVDDIQFISGKKATQEEFFHVFNFLYERKIQIIITSDKYPHEIPDIEERLRNRFEWGLISDIQPPDHHHRSAILSAKAKHLGLTLDHEVAEYMAHRWCNNIRELEGTLRRLVAQAHFHHHKIDLKLIHEVFPTHHPHKQPPKPDIQNIIDIISKHYGVSTEELRSKKRIRKIAHPRQIGFYLARQLTDASFPQIGIAFGGKDHSTVMHGVKRVAESLKTDDKLKMELMFIQRNLIIPSGP